MFTLRHACQCEASLSLARTPTLGEHAGYDYRADASGPIPFETGPRQRPCPAPCPGGTETIRNGNDICSMGPDYPGGSRFPRVGGDRPSTHACSRTSQGVAQPFRLGVDRYRRSRESAFMHCPEGNCMEVSPRLLHPLRCIKGPTRAGRLEISGNHEKNRMAQMEDGRQLGQGSGRAAGRRAHN